MIEFDKPCGNPDCDKLMYRENKFCCINCHRKVHPEDK